MSSRPRSPRRLAYLCLQPTREGQASHAHVLEIIAGLRRRGWIVTLVQPPAPPAERRFDAARRALGMVSAQARFILAVLRRRPDAAYIRGHFAALPSALVLRCLRIPTFQEVNGPVEDAYDLWPWLRRFDGLVRSATRRQLEWAEQVIAVTPGLAGYSEGLGRRRTRPVVIGNGADPERFHPPSAAMPQAGEPYAVFVGALASWQGIPTLLAATRSAAWPSELRLVIAGDGHDRGLVRDATRDGRVVWHAHVPYAEVPGLVGQARVAVVPKTAASTGLSPLKLFEAMACAVPVVVSDVPGLADVVRREQCGLVARAGDPEALARAVADLASAADGAACGRRGRVAVLEKYSWDARAGATDEVIRAGLERRRGVRNG